jgi:hypothetical protein
MEIDLLQPLEGRWPNDKVLIKKQPSLKDVEDMLSTPAGQNYYQDKLVIDEQDSAIISNFAAKNNMSYSPSTDVEPEQYGKRIPAWLGVQTKATQPVFTHEIKGTLHGYAISFCLAYAPAVVQSTRGTHTDDPTIESVQLTRKSIIRITLPKIFPQIVLDSNKNDEGYMSTIPASFKDSQKMVLEGDFAKYFDFYSPVGLQVNTMAVLAPNFMQILINSASTFDVEFYGPELILVTRDPIYTPSVMQTALTALEAQLHYMDRLLLSWDYQPVNQPFDLLHKTYFDGTVAKIGPLRIKPAAMLIIALLCFALYGLWITLTR